MKTTCSRMLVCCFACLLALPLSAKSNANLTVKSNISKQLNPITKNQKEQHIPQLMKRSNRSLKAVNTPMVLSDPDTQINRSITPSQANKAASDFSYLEGFNLSLASYLHTEDQALYGADLQNKYFIPQGLTQDKDGQLLISMYHGIQCPPSQKPCSVKPSIVVRYQPDTNMILNIYTLEDMPVGAHVGGIGYHHESQNGEAQEWLFLSHGQNIRLYEITTGLLHELSYVQSYLIGHATSAMSSSHGYLWIADYVNPLNTRHLTGYKITYDANQAMVDLVKKYAVKQPKFYIQGVYCDSDPETEKRLRFYLTASNNISYIYQSMLTAKDLDESGIIDQDDEYYWESQFSPFGYKSGLARKLPDGGEGTTIKNGKMWMLNEGATNFYCNKWGNGEDIDCSREILVVNPVTVNDHSYSVFPAGSIKITGVGLEDFGYKLALVFSQNKEGRLYYSIGEFTCKYGSCKLFLNEPSTPNPVGKQINYLGNKKATAYIEDVVGVYFMNLAHEGNKDDFILSRFKIGFDDNEHLENGEPYAISRDISRYFGDHSYHKHSMEYYFQFKHSFGIGTVGSDKQHWDRGILAFNTNYDNLLENLNACYASNTEHSICRKEALETMEAYLESDSEWFLNNKINKDISRLFNIEP